MTVDDLVAGRKRLRLTQAEAGALVGVTQQTIWRIERGEATPAARLYSAFLAERLARLDGVPLAAPTAPPGG
jgi:DNA-binding XRE family transcriptional regulator